MIPILPFPSITNLFALSVISRIQNPVLLTPLIPGCSSHTLSGVSYVFSNLIEERSFPAFKWRRESGLSSPIPSLPTDVMRSLSLPAVSIETVSAEGNLIAVFVSPV